jgi:DNA processing protein
VIKKIKLVSKNYPEQLKQLNNPPQELNVVGSANLLKAQKAIAIIGSRQMTPYGRDVAYDLTGRLVQHDFTIVSGLASGVDQTAHEIALLLQGKTIGVLGYGLNLLKKSTGEYELVKKMAAQPENALILSPFSNSQKMQKHTFINRNKVIAGLSMGTIVIEAVQRSGTFHTVEASIELGRPAFAVPGSIFSQNSKGTHFLIKSGATLVESVQDILADFDKSAF